MISCEKIQEMISSMLDGQLSDEERAAVEEHIALCPECAAMYEDFSALSISLKEEFSAVPAQLHDKIMSGVKARRRKAKIIPLRAYLSAAACLVLVVGAVLAVGNGRSYDKAVPAAPAAPAALAEPAAPAEAAAPMAPDMNSFILERNEIDYGVPAEPAAPAPVPMPEPEYGAEDSFSAEENAEVYYPGMEIDWASIIYSGETEYLSIGDIAALSKLLMESPAEIESSAIPAEPSAILELGHGPYFLNLKLYFIGESVVVEIGGRVYMAVGTVEEFLSLK